MREFSKVVKDMIKAEVEQIHTSLPAIVERVDGMNVDVQPLVNIFRNGTHRKLPIIHGVPFQAPRVKRCGIQWNPEKGDKVLLLVSEVSIDNLMVSKDNSIVNSEDGRAFDLSDAVAITGFQNESENAPLPADEGLRINFDDQKIVIKTSN